MDVSVICTKRAYFSSSFNGNFLMNSLGKFLPEKCTYVHVFINNTGFICFVDNRYAKLACKDDK